MPAPAGDRAVTMGEVPLSAAQPQPGSTSRSSLPRPWHTLLLAAIAPAGTKKERVCLWLSIVPIYSPGRVAVTLSPSWPAGSALSCTTLLSGPLNPPTSPLLSSPSLGQTISCSLCPLFPLPTPGDILLPSQLVPWCYNQTLPYPQPGSWH